jgi:hypothetical protein
MGRIAVGWVSISFHVLKSTFANPVKSLRKD